MCAMVGGRMVRINLMKPGVVQISQLSSLNYAEAAKAVQSQCGSKMRSLAAARGFELSMTND